MSCFHEISLPKSVSVNFLKTLKTRNSLPCKIFLSYQFRVKLFSEKVALTEFLRQNIGSKIPKFPHCAPVSNCTKVLLFLCEINSTLSFSVAKSYIV